MMEKMRFGLRKMTLLDFPGRVACTIFTCGCNFRCPFCHNASLVRGSEEDMELSAAELFAFLEKRKKLLDGVAVTGGEPLMHAGSVELLKKMRRNKSNVKHVKDKMSSKKTKKTQNYFEEKYYILCFFHLTYQYNVVLYKRDRDSGRCSALFRNFHPCGIFLDKKDY